MAFEERITPAYGRVGHHGRDGPGDRENKKRSRRNDGGHGAVRMAPRSASPIRKLQAGRATSTKSTRIYMG